MRPSIFEVKGLQQFDQAKQRLQGELTRFFSREERETKTCGEKRIWRIEIPFDQIEPLTWLRHQSFPIKTYWSDRKGVFRMAGVGLAHVTSGHYPIDYQALFSRLKKTLSVSHPNVRYYGGLRFDYSQRSDRDWALFDDYRFVIPRFEIFATENNTRLACNFIWPSEKDAYAQLKQLESEIDNLQSIEDRNPQELPCLQTRDDIPGWEQWEESVQSAMQMLEQGELQKIVLARKSILTFNRSLNPILLLQRLAAKNSHTFHFCFQLADECAFIGVTPELLYRRNHREVYSEAIAGTRARGGSPEADKRLGQELLDSEKDLREHRWVSEMVKHSLQPLCHSLDTLAHETLITLPHVQHLYSQFQGELKEMVGDWDILTNLQPSPAVGGFPKHQSLQKIAQIEPFDRGWYAGPIGWVSEDSAEFTVGIRSALVSGNTLSLFAGAGIVQGSNPQTEWEENENKIMNFTKLFEANGDSLR